jgi:hypothetical protein
VNGIWAASSISDVLPHPDNDHVHAVIFRLMDRTISFINSMAWREAKISLESSEDFFLYIGLPPCC